MCVFMGLLLPTCVADHRALSFPAEMRRILDPASAPTGRIDPARTDGPRGRDARGPEAPRAARAIDCSPDAGAPPTTGGRGTGRRTDHRGGARRRGDAA